MNKLSLGSLWYWLNILKKKILKNYTFLICQSHQLVLSHCFEVELAKNMRLQDPEVVQYACL